MAKSTGKGLYGVGINSKGIYPTGFFVNDTDKLDRPKAYKTWRSMLMRCYSTKHHTTHITGSSYQGCSVSEEWKDYQNFAKWYEEFYIDGWEIDKDIMILGNRVYSPTTCVFLPVSINSFFKGTIKRKDINLPAGVDKAGKNSFRVSSCYSKELVGVNSFTTTEEAEKVYLYLKGTALLKEVAYYADQLPDPVIERLVVLAKYFREGMSWQQQVARCL